MVAFYGACVEPTASELILVLEHTHGQKLQEVVALPHDRLGLHARASLVHDVASALAYLHAQRPAVVHGDISASNILVERWPSGKMRAKLLDFGLSRLMCLGAKSLGGTLAWMAPEVLSGVAMLHTSADIFSCGWLLFMTITGRHPANAETTGSALAELELWEYPRCDEFGGYGVPELFAACVQDEPAARPQATKVLQALARCRQRSGPGSPGVRCCLAEVLERVRRALPGLEPREGPQQLSL